MFTNNSDKVMFTLHSLHLRIFRMTANEFEIRAANYSKIKVRESTNRA